MKLSKSRQSACNKLVAELEEIGFEFDKKVPVEDDGYFVYLRVKSEAMFNRAPSGSLTAYHLNKLGYNCNADYNLETADSVYRFWSLRFDFSSDHPSAPDFLTYESVYGQLVIQF